MSALGKAWRWFRPKLRVAAAVGGAIKALFGVKSDSAGGKVIDATVKGEAVVEVVEAASTRAEKKP